MEKSQFVRLHSLDKRKDMNGRYGILFSNEDPSTGRFAVRICTTMNEPNTELRIKKQNITPIELFIVLMMELQLDGEVRGITSSFPSFSSSSVVDMKSILGDEDYDPNSILEETLDTVNPMIQNDVDADFKPKLLISYHVNTLTNGNNDIANGNNISNPAQKPEQKTEQKTEQKLQNLKQKLQQRFDKTMLESKGYRCEVIEVEDEEIDQVASLEPKKKSCSENMLSEPTSRSNYFDLHLQKLSQFICNDGSKDSSWVIFQSPEGLSCSTRFATCLKSFMDAKEDVKRIHYNVQARWKEPVPRAFLPPRNADEVDQLFENAVMELVTTPKGTDLVEFAIRGDAVKDYLQKSESKQEPSTSLLDFTSNLPTHNFFPEEQGDGLIEPLDWFYLPNARNIPYVGGAVCIDTVGGSGSGKKSIRECGNSTIEEIGEDIS